MKYWPSRKLIIASFNQILETDIDKKFQSNKI